MWLLWKGGLPIEDVLRATTMTNAEKLGVQEEIGSLKVGKNADFLVLDENPLDDILIARLPTPPTSNRTKYGRSATLSGSS